MNWKIYIDLTSLFVELMKSWNGGIKNYIIIIKDQIWILPDFDKRRYSNFKNNFLRINYPAMMIEHCVATKCRKQENCKLWNIEQMFSCITVLTYIITKDMAVFSDFVTVFVSFSYVFLGLISKSVTPLSPHWVHLGLKLPPWLWRI